MNYLMSCKHLELRRFEIIKKALVMTVGICIAAGAFAHDLTGRDVADHGELMTLTGVLRSDGNELYLKADGTTYLIHMGPDWYAEEIGFPAETGKAATISGFVYSETA